MTPRGSTIAKFLFASMFICGIIATILTGCGTSNNPSGPVAAVSDPVTASLEPGNFSIVGRVVADNNNPIGNISIKLFAQNQSTGNLFDSGRSSKSLTSGEFSFSNLGSGTFVIKIEETTKFLESSKLAIIDGAGSVSSIDVGDVMVLAKASLDPLVPTLDLKGKVTSSLSASPLSVAQITLDTGYSTVSNGFGIFELKNIEVGNRRITINQPGVSSYTISFVVNGSTPPNAESILLNNDTYAVNVGSRTVDLEKHNFAFQINPNLHPSGSLMGTVKRYVDNKQSTLEPFPYFQFDLWGINLQGNEKRKLGAPETASDGTWRVDNLPPFEGGSCYAVAAGTEVDIIPSDGGNLLVLQNMKWNAGEPILASGYPLAAGTTTIMDFTVPYSESSSRESGMTAIADATLSYAAGGVATQALLTDDLTLAWTGPGTATQVIFELEMLPQTDSSQSIEKTIQITSESTAPNSFSFRPADLKLKFGLYNWNMTVTDPTRPELSYPSSSKTIAIRPSNTDKSPANSSEHMIDVVAPYKIPFAAPNSANTEKVVFEMRDMSGTIVKSLQGLSSEFEVEFDASKPIEGDYSWQIRYFFTDGSTMTSEPAIIKLTKPSINLDPIIASIEDSTGTEVTESFIAEPLDIVWTKDLPNKNFSVEFIRLYKDAANPTVVLPINKPGNAPGSSRFRPSEIGLDFGFYSWRTKVADTNVNSIEAVSNTKLLTIRPSNTDVTPQQGTRVLISPATYSLTLAAPYDSEASSAVLELYSPSGALIPTEFTGGIGNSASYVLTWKPNTPAPGIYSWRVVYLYPDGKTMISQMSELIFE